ncbi:MAG TPA: hypothetical protein VF221_05385 [Chloroflexota bacterium]
MNRFLVILAAFVLLSTLTGCSSGLQPSSSSSGSAKTSRCGIFTKADIVYRVTVASLAFNDYLYQKWQQGDLRPGTSTIKQAVGTVTGPLKSAEKAVGGAGGCGASGKLLAALDGVQRQLAALQSPQTQHSNSALGTRIRSINHDFSRAASAEGEL